MTTDNNSLARRPADSGIATSQDNRHALQPRSMKEAYDLAKAVAGTPFAPGMTPQGAFACIMSGAELGMTAMQSLRAYVIVKGKPTLWADAMVAVVLASGLCEEWDTIETTAERCEIVTRRKGSKREQRRVWTPVEAGRAKLLGSDTWKMYPAQMLRHRCASDLARDVYPDVLLGVYSQEEMRDSAPLRGDPEPDASFQLPVDNNPGVRMADLAAANAPDTEDDNERPATRPVTVEPHRPAIDAPLPTAEAPIVEAPPVALPLSANDLRAMLDELTSATDLAALRAAWKGMADDEKRGTEEQRAALLDAATKRKAVFAEEARLRAERKAAADGPTPDDDGPAKPPRGPRKPRTPVAPADATGGAAEGATEPAGDPSAIDRSGARASSGASLESRAARRAYLATLDYAPAVRTSYARRSDLPHYREDCAERLCAIDAAVSRGLALAYLDNATRRTTPAAAKARAA
jgi:hypothetical protein